MRELIFPALLVAVAGCAPAAPAATPAPAVALEDQVIAAVSWCKFDAMRGSVINGSAETLDVVLLLTWSDGSTRVDETTETVTALEPGKKATWSVTRPPTGRAGECAATVRSAKP